MINYKDKKIRLGIVIGSGGIQSLAALPLLNFLSERDVQIDVLAGCGGGAVLGALFGIGFSPDDIISHMSQLFNKNTILQVNYSGLINLLALMGITAFSNIGLKSTFLKVDRIRECYESIFKQKKLSHLKIKTLVQATDWHKGEGVVLEEGLLSDVLYSSNALFPFQPPLELENRLLVAGTYTGAIPVLATSKYELDLVAVIGFAQRTFSKLKGIIEYYCNLINYSFTHLQKGQLLLHSFSDRRELAPILIAPDESIGLWDHRKIKYILKIGEKTKEKYGPLLLTMIDNLMKVKLK